MCYIYFVVQKQKTIYHDLFFQKNKILMRVTQKTSNIVLIRNELLYWFNWTECGGLNTNTAPLPSRIQSYNAKIPLPRPVHCHCISCTHIWWILEFFLFFFCICFHTYFCSIFFFIFFNSLYSSAFPFFRPTALYWLC